MGRHAGAERAKLMRKLGDLIAKHVPEIAQLRPTTAAR
jgi:acyl-CoA reductase-like NAD-dependent aldehyde dehydrogenase